MGQLGEAKESTFITKSTELMVMAAKRQCVVIQIQLQQHCLWKFLSVQGEGELW